MNMKYVPLRARNVSVAVLAGASNGANEAQDHQVAVGYAAGVAAGGALATVSVVIGGVEVVVQTLKAPSDAAATGAIYLFTAKVDAVKITPANGLTLDEVRWDALEAK